MIIDVLSSVMKGGQILSNLDWVVYEYPSKICKVLTYNNTVQLTSFICRGVKIKIFRRIKLNKMEVQLNCAVLE